jgi:hypothetical protein
MFDRDPKEFTIMVKQWISILLKETKTSQDFNVRLGCVKSLEVSNFLSLQQETKKKPILFRQE